MAERPNPRCAPCETKHCRTGTDCFATAEQHLAMYGDREVGELHRAASAIEARHYCQAPRLQETLLFARELGCKRLGLAFCVGLADEAKVIEEILAQDFEVVSVCCKLSGIAKRHLNLERISVDNPDEVMCNPAGQADLLNQAQTDLNIVCGLCVGHDAMFAKMSNAPVTTLIVKDRVLAHNPIGAVYSPYIRRTFEKDDNEDREVP
jgi:uncharacterized metal-binding protein